MGEFGGPEKDCIVFCGTAYVLSQWILLANCMPFSIMVTCLACIMHKLVSSNNSTRYASTASCDAITAAGDTQHNFPMLHVLYNLPHQTFKGGPPNQEFSRLLVTSNFSQRNSTWPVPLVFPICPWLFAFLMPSPCSCCLSGFIVAF